MHPSIRWSIDGDNGSVPPRVPHTTRSHCSYGMIYVAILLLLCVDVTSSFAIPLFKSWSFTSAEDVIAKPQTVEETPADHLKALQGLDNTGQPNNVVEPQGPQLRTIDGPTPPPKDQLKTFQSQENQRVVEESTRSTTEPLESKTKNDFPQSDMQWNAVQSTAPAVLLKSGPGTGKSYALASRVAYLIETGACRPENMVVLSFTNRDANSLKSRAIDMLYNATSAPSTESACSELNLTRKELSSRLWGGTIHSFAISLYRTYSKNRSVRVLSSKEMRMRVDRCLVNMLANKSFLQQGRRQQRGNSSGNHDRQKLRSLRLLHRDALGDLRQSRGMLLHQISRCVELWKESGLLPPPADKAKLDTYSDMKELRDNCIEVSMRLGIQQSVGQLALVVFPEYQALHKNLGTVDPSDLASLTHNFLLTKPNALNTLRTKLHHLVLDEYQDVSVTQHALLRLLIRGHVDEEIIGSNAKSRPNDCTSSAPPVLPMAIPKKEKSMSVSFRVPHLFCAGDSDQSIYGWRGAAPALSVEGFRSDYPQGVVIPLDTSYRLPRNIWNAASALAGSNNSSSLPMDCDHVRTFRTSPVAFAKHRQTNNGADSDTLPMLFASQRALDEQTSTVHIQGLWDAREEAKYIASEIRKRSKQRIAACAKALSKITPEDGSKVTDLANFIRDPSDVAVMVRSAAQMKLLKEAFGTIGIPFATVDGDESETSRTRRKNTNTASMKPVVIMTMHRAKGAEFDDVYLSGWTEGVFPHPTAVSTNRVQEERRLAFVAITRARQHVGITHSFVSRDLHQGPDLKNKYVTTQVEPSRFLYELVSTVWRKGDMNTRGPNVIRQTSSDGVPNVVWDRGTGFKELVAGRNVPAFFAKSYSVPPGYVHPNSAQNKGDLERLIQKDPSNDASTAIDLNAPLETPSDDALSMKKTGMETQAVLERSSAETERKTFGVTLKGEPCRICLKQGKFCQRRKGDLDRRIQKDPSSNTSTAIDLNAPLETPSDDARSMKKTGLETQPVLERRSAETERKTFGVTLKGEPCKICLKQGKFCKRHKHQEVRDAYSQHLVAGSIQT